MTGCNNPLESVNAFVFTIDKALDFLTPYADTQYSLLIYYRNIRTASVNYFIVCALLIIVERCVMNFNGSDGGFQRVGH